MTTAALIREQATEAHRSAVSGANFVDLSGIKPSLKAEEASAANADPFLSNELMETAQMPMDTANAVGGDLSTHEPKMGQPHLKINAANQPIGPLASALLASAARRREQREAGR